MISFSIWNLSNALAWNIAPIRETANITTLNGITVRKSKS